MASVSASTDTMREMAPDAAPSPLDRLRAVTRLHADQLAGASPKGWPSSPPSRKAVLVALVGHADRQGACWLRVATIADETGYGDRTVRSALTWLVEAGWLTRERVHNDLGHRKVYAFTVNVARLIADHSRPATIAARPPATIAAEKGGTNPEGDKDKPPPTPSTAPAVERTVKVAPPSADCQRGPRPSVRRARAVPARPNPPTTGTSRS